MFETSSPVPPKPPAPRCPWVYRLTDYVLAILGWELTHYLMNHIHINWQ